MAALYDRISKHAKKEGVCLGCNRGFQKDELPDLFEYVRF